MNKKIKKERRECYNSVKKEKRKKKDFWCLVKLNKHFKILKN